MQHNPREDIKGDYKVDARGSSVLLAREIQAQNLFQIVTQLGPHPVFGQMLENRSLLRKLLQSMMLSSDELMLSNDEIDAIVAAAQSNAGNQAAAAEAANKMQEMQLRQEEIALKRQELEIESYKAQANANAAMSEIQAKREIAGLKHDEALTKAINDSRARMTEAAIRMQVEDKKIGSKERMMAAEIALTQRIGPSGGGIA
jgi:hypothetical protein